MTPGMTPEIPERCGQRYIVQATGEEYRCTLAAEHRGEFHRSDDGSTWSRAGDLQSPTMPAQPDRPCGALLKIELPTKNPTRHTVRCALGVGHQNMPHRAADGTQWDTATPGAAGTVMDQATARRYNELLRLVSPDDAAALNLGPIIERQRLATNDRHYHNDIAASQADVMPLIREVMRLRRPKPAMPGDATLRSALPGLARQIEHMTHVFGELRDATCTGCQVVALSSNPEDGADLEPLDGCPVHGDTAELRRGHSWMLVQYERILGALGPEWSVPFPPGDPTAKAVEYITTARNLERDR